MYGTLSCTPEGKCDSIATEMVGRFKETGHPVFKGISAMSRGILKTKGGRCTIHFNADSSCSELLFRTIHSTNFNSVSTELFQVGVKSSLNGIRIKNSRLWRSSQQKRTSSYSKKCEVNSLLQTPRVDNRASGDRLRECIQRFETLEKEILFTRVCEDATFARRVSVGMSYETIPDVDDGFWRPNSSMQRTHSFSRRSKFQDPPNDSRINCNLTSFSSSYHTIS